MKRIFIGVSAFYFILVACRVFTPDIAMPDRVTPSQLPSNPTATTTQPTATNTFTPTTQPTLTPTPTPASTPGSYIVTNTIAPSGGCGEIIATSPFEINNHLREWNISRSLHPIIYVFLDSNLVS